MFLKASNIFIRTFVHIDPNPSLLCRYVLRNWTDKKCGIDAGKVEKEHKKVNLKELVTVLFIRKYWISCSLFFAPSFFPVVIFIHFLKCAAAWFAKKIILRGHFKWMHGIFRFSSECFVRRWGDGWLRCRSTKFNVIKFSVTLNTFRADEKWTCQMSFCTSLLDRRPHEFG